MAFNQIDTDDEVTEKDGLLLNNTHPNKQPDNNPESPGNNPDSITKWERVTAAFRKRLKKDGLRLILLIVLNGFYLYFGGLIFYMLERKPRVVVDEKDHVGMLIDTFKSLNHKSLDLKNMTSTDVKKITSTLKRIHNEMSESESESWTVTNGVFFASTVVTTIGYGNMAPTTDGGRWFCVMYAVVGIPLTLMFLALVGKIISKYINNVCSFIVKTVKKHLNSDYEYDRVEEGTELRAPVWLAVLFMIVVTSIFAGVFMKMEEWSFTKSLYFIFITFTTIGFGDIVPHNSKAIWFNVTFLYIGLASVSITINLLIANITMQYRKHKEKIEIVRKIEEELDDSDNDDDELLASHQHNNNDVTEMSNFQQQQQQQQGQNGSKKHGSFESSKQGDHRKRLNQDKKYTGL